MARTQALVIDDEPDICELLAMTLGRMDLDVITADCVSSGKQQLEQHDIAICLTDMRLPDGDGLELVEWIQHNKPGTPVAVITAHGNVETAVQALKNGAFDFVSKPLDLGHLRTIVDNALKLSSANETDDGKLLGQSASMQELRELISRVARSQAPVHISGESGTGKELVARQIHDSGARAEGPFIPVNCGAIPAELMESEFFGHRKGSFTGAVSDKQGLFQSANGGTLFLDEIADLPLSMQVKLLRVIQEQAVRSVGSSKEESVDVRILSATHKNLAAMVADGEFREDLFYRINVIELKVPPLRDREDDALLLARHILNKFDKSITLTEDAEATLLKYAFPGNVRELENMLERAVTLAVGGRIKADDLVMRTTESSSQSASATVSGKDLGGQVEDVQRQAIIDALKKTRYNKTAAAKLLGLTFRQLRYRIKKLEIEA